MLRFPEEMNSLFQIFFVLQATLPELALSCVEGLVEGINSDKNIL